ncbi:MAG: ABC transporter permease [Acidobacteria bacterium]|nr:ABC transporter permease [Acidobacteriota bacterium]
MWRRTAAIIKKEFLQTLREPRMRVVLLLPPIIQLIVFGYAVNLDVENSPIAWMDQDRTPESRELLAEFEGSPQFRVTHIPAGEEEIQELLDRSAVQAVVRVLPGFGRDIRRGQRTQVQILVDGTNSNSATIISNSASQVVARYAGRIQGEQRTRQRTVSGPGPVRQGPLLSAESRVWFNVDLKSQNYFVPGVVVNIIALVTLMLTAMAIVREKESGTMEQLMVTPIRPIELMLGKTLPFAAVGLLEVLMVTGAALLIFGIPFRGSMLLLLGCAAAFLLTTLGFGLLISTVSSTQQQAMMASFFFFMPAFMLSGFAFPIRNMPLAVQYLTYLNPVRYFMEIVRGIFLKGIGLDVLWPQVMALLVLGTALVGLSVLRFHKRLD